MGKARNYIKALRQGHKIYPEDIAGMLGLPSVGVIRYVDAASGSDTNNGKTRASAFATVAAAEDAMTADQDDVLVITGSNSTGRTAETSAITWDKNRTHIIGNGPLRKINPRQGMAFGASISPGLTVSAKDCSFTNISIATFEDNNILVDVTGDYNTFTNVHFQGIGNATAGDDTAARSLRISAGEENEFYSCTIGLDTVARSAANASLELTGSCPRNKFVDCDFPTWADNSGALTVKADTGNCYERTLIFDHCLFHNPDVAGGATKMTVHMDLSATGNGTIILYDSYQHGATDWANDFTAVHSAGIPTVPTQATAGFMQVLT